MHPTKWGSLCEPHFSSVLCYDNGARKKLRAWEFCDGRNGKITAWKG